MDLRPIPIDKSMGYSRVSLTGLQIICRLIAFATVCFMAAINTYAECHYKPELCEQIANADGVFFGKAIREEIRPVQTRNRGLVKYINVLFEVERSWKFVDREYIWIPVGERGRDERGYTTTDRKYLISFTRANDNIYVSKLTSESAAAADLEDLGAGTVALRSGTFRLYRTFAWGMLILFVLVLLLSIYFYKLNKRPTEKVWA